MMKRDLTQREKMILTTCLLVVGAFGIMQLVIRPLQQHDDALDLQIRRRTEELKKNHKSWQSASTLTQKYYQYEHILGQKQDDAAQMRNFVSVVQQAAGRTGVNLQNFQPLKIVSKQTLKHFSIQMTVEGRWDSLAEFFHILQSQPNYVIINELALERSSSDTPNVRGRILISQIRLDPS